MLKYVGKCREMLILVKLGFLKSVFLVLRNFSEFFLGLLPVVFLNRGSDQLQGDTFFDIIWHNLTLFDTIWHFWQWEERWKIWLKNFFKSSWRRSSRKKFFWFVLGSFWFEIKHFCRSCNFFVLCQYLSIIVLVLFWLTFDQRLVWVFPTIYNIITVQNNTEPFF